jgi:FkbM family methyltransferase
MLPIRKNLGFQKRNIYHYLPFIILASFFICIICCAKPEPQRYIYIIGGAHKGERINSFKKQDVYRSYLWEIFAIEANPYLIDKIPKAPDTIILNKAIWIKDDKIKFYFIHENDSLGSVYKEHNGMKYTKPMFVESIDFSQWIKRNFTANDCIIVSLDIEGSEYDVLNKMIADNTIKYIHQLIVEFHPGTGGKSESDIKELIQKIKKLNVNIERGEF